MDVKTPRQANIEVMKNMQVMEARRLSKKIRQSSHTHTHTHTMDAKTEYEARRPEGLHVLDLVKCKTEQKQ